MNREEALTILESQTKELRSQPYEHLRQYLDGAVVVEVLGSSGAQYQIEIEAVWDHKPESDLHILVSIDDGTLWSSFAPLTDDFIISPNGTFVGE